MHDPTQEEKNLDAVAGWVLLPFVGLMASPLLFFAHWAFSSWSNRSIAVPLALVSVLVWYAITMKGAQFLYQGRRAEIYEPRQQQRAWEAREVINRLRSGRSPNAYFVYLRSFQTEDFSYEWYSTFASPSSIGATNTFDDELMFAFDGAATIVSLGDQVSNRLGVPRLQSSDQDWRRDIDLLLNSCAGIIVCPWNSAGILEETKAIISRPNLIAKTIFVMMPRKYGVGANFEYVWDAVREQFPRGIYRPTYSEHGMLFNADGDRIDLYTITDRDSLKSAVLHLLELARMKRG